MKGAFAKWQTNGVVTLQTGMPFNVSTGTDTANTSSSGTYRPNLVGTPLRLRTGSPGRLHRSHGVLHLGDSVSGRPQLRLREPRPKHLPRSGCRDGRLVAVQELPDQRAAEIPIRFETFGLFNHSNFANPSATFATSSFGNITGARQPEYSAGREAAVLISNGGIAGGDTARYHQLIAGTTGFAQIHN